MHPQGLRPATNVTNTCDPIRRRIGSGRFHPSGHNVQVHISNLHALPLVGLVLSAGGNGAMELRRSRESCVRTSCTWWRPVRSVARCRREVRPVRRQQVEVDFVILPPDLLKTRHEKLALFLDGQSTEPRKGCERRFHPEPVGIGVSTTSSRGGDSLWLRRLRSSACGRDRLSKCFLLAHFR